MATRTFKLPEGIEVANLSGIFEAYSVKRMPDGHYVFTLNVSAENIATVFCRLAAEVNEPAFLLFEMPTHRDIEEQLRKSDTDPFHRDIYYFDGLVWDNAKGIFDQYQYLLYNDGEVNFGLGSHEGHDEVFVAAYKIFHIYADDPRKYHEALKELGFEEVPQVKTVWENFSEQAPGRRLVLKNADPTIWQMVEQLKDRGLYLAERREG